MDCQKKSINVRYKTPTHTKILLPADRVYENNKKKKRKRKLEQDDSNLITKKYNLHLSHDFLVIYFW